MTFVDDQKREVLKEAFVSVCDRLDAAEDDFLISIFQPETGGKYSAFETVASVLRMILFDEFLHMSEDQNATLCDAPEFSDHKAFASACRQHNNGWRTVRFKKLDGVFDRLLLIVSKLVHVIEPYNKSAFLGMISGSDLFAASSVPTGKTQSLRRAR